MKLKKLIAQSAFSALLFGAMAVGAEEVLWTGADAESDSWSSAENWSGSVEAFSLAGKDVVFGVADMVKAGVVNGVISADLTINSLVFTNSSYVLKENKTDYWHSIAIAPDATLTINGTNEQGVAFAMKAMTSKGKDYRHSGVAIAGGALVVDSPEGKVYTMHESSSDTSYPYLDLSGLNSFTCTADTLIVAEGQRTAGWLNLARSGDGANVLTLNKLYVGRKEGDVDNGTQELRLGKTTRINADLFCVGACEWSERNSSSGKVFFPEGLEGATLTIRAKDGAGRAEFHCGGIGGKNPSGKWAIKSKSGLFDATGGEVDALFSTLAVGEGHFASSSGKNGPATGEIKFAKGVIDATNAVFGCGTSNSSSARSVKPSVGRLTMSGGRFVVQYDCTLGRVKSGAGEAANGYIDLAGGEIDIGGLLQLTAYEGYAPAATSVVTVANASLTARGGLVGGDAKPSKTDVDYDVYAEITVGSGGVLAVTNGTATSELRLEDATLVLRGGEVFADNLILTNSASTLCVVVGENHKGITVGKTGFIELGGALVVAAEDGYRPSGQYVIASGGSITGRFSSVDLPAGYKVRYGGGTVSISKGGCVVTIR